MGVLVKGTVEKLIITHIHVFNFTERENMERSLFLSPPEWKSESYCSGDSSYSWCLLCLKCNIIISVQRGAWEV